MIDTPRTSPGWRTAPTPISPERWALLESFIDGALDLPPERRDDYFDRMSGGDPSFQAQLVRLVTACERGDALLDASAGERFAALFDEAPPEVLNERFVIEREIGRGGMAVVYLSYDRKHERQVAVKVLGPEASAAIGADRFDREIKVVARLQHPNIVPLYDSGDEQGWLYYVMPVMSGGSLRQRLENGAGRTLDDAQRVVRDITAALEHAHEHDIVHRDVKPENILFDGERAMLADFGVARPRLNTGGGAAGTPEYMSPEQAAGGPIDARSDVYSLAAVVHEMLGAFPPHAEGVADAGGSQKTSRPDVPRAVSDVLDRATAHNVEVRFPSAEAFGSAFAATGAPTMRRSSVRRRFAFALVSLAVVVVAALGVVIARARHRPNPDAFELYLHGTDQRLFRSDSGARAAVGLLSRAVALDPSFPAAFAALSRAYNAVCLGTPGVSRLVACDSGAAVARHAIAMDSTLADGYVELAWASLNRLDFAAAAAAARRATIIEPNNPDAYEFVALVALWSGRFNDAIVESRRDLALSPRSVDAIAHLGRVLALAGREDEALVVLQPLRSLRPRVRRVTDAVETIYEDRKMWREATVEAGPDSGRIARILAESGHTAEARAMLAGLEKRWQGGRGRAWDVAGVYIALHDYDSAFTWLDRSVDDLSLRVNIIEPNFADLWADPRFTALMKRLGLPVQ
jgi:tetratricopeptide (TPR) repeat protein